MENVCKETKPKNNILVNTFVCIFRPYNIWALLFWIQHLKCLLKFITVLIRQQMNNYTYIYKYLYTYK